MQVAVGWTMESRGSGTAMGSTKGNRVRHSATGWANGSSGQQEAMDWTKGKGKHSALAWMRGNAEGIRD